MNIALREAAAGDADRLLEMMADFNAGEGIAVDRETWRPALLRLLAEPDLGRVWLIAEGGALAGYLVLTFGYDLEFGGRDSFLTELYLLPAARGRGLGGQTMAALEAEAAALGAKAIHLMVRPENAPAVALYRSAGYEPPPRVLLSKRLAPPAPRP